MASSSASRISIYILFLGLIVNLSIALALLLTRDTQRTTSKSLYEFVISSRTATQILVQIVAQALGTLLTFAVTSLLNYTSRIRLARTPTSIESVKLWLSVCFSSPDWSLSTPNLLLSILLLSLVFVPPALWAGALTPFVVLQDVKSSIAIAVYSPDADGVYWNRSASPEYQYNAVVDSNGKGLYSYNPTAFSGSIALSAAFATTDGSKNRTHAKLDNSRYSYRGRSFGVGASIGIFGVADQNEQSVRSYTFNEVGYMTQVSCTHNATSMWRIQPLKGSNCDGYETYAISGALPNSIPGTVESVSLPGLCGDTSRVLGMGGRMVNNRTIVAMAAGAGAYGVLDKMQCELWFKPTLFRLEVDTQRLLIDATPVNGTDFTDVDPTSAVFGAGFGIVAGMAAQLVASMPSTTSMQRSPIADALTANIRNAASIWNTSDTDSSIVARAVSDSMESIVDDTLLAYSSAQLMIAGQVEIGARTTVPVTAQINAIRVGDRTYVTCVLALTTIILAAALIEALRTRGWQHLPLFDYKDLQHVIDGRETGQSMAAAGLQKTRPVEKVRIKLDGNGYSYSVVSDPVDMEDDDPSVSRIQNRHLQVQKYPTTR